MSNVAARRKVDPVTDEKRCELTELYKTECAHCRTPRRAPLPLFVEPTLNAVVDDDDFVVATFSAQYPGRCIECGVYFPRGSWVSRTRDGEMLHQDCAPS